MCTKDYICKDYICIVGVLLAYIIEELVITCDETMNTTKTVPTKTVLTKFNEKR